MLDASSSGAFSNKSTEAKWDIIERIQKNTEDWEIDKGELSANLGAMASPKSPKDKFLVNVINPYLAEVKRHPQTLWVEDGVLHEEDLKGPIKEGSTRARLEEVEQEVLKYKLMIERDVDQLRYHRRAEERT
ncbi:hypothetical protein ZWY2020_050190 [Hordeum vulgare]|nr:hypothetical protein ZWY2020_050190 [Hordeum vulgare]